MKKTIIVSSGITLLIALVFKLSPSGDVIGAALVTDQSLPHDQQSLAKIEATPTAVLTMGLFVAAFTSPAWTGPRKSIGMESFSKEISKEILLNRLD